MCVCVCMYKRKTLQYWAIVVCSPMVRETGVQS